MKTKKLDLRLVASDMRMQRKAAKRVLEDVATLLGLENDYVTIHWLSQFICELDNGGVQLYQIKITSKGFWLLENKEIVENAAKEDGAKNKGRLFQSVSELEEYLATVYQSQISAFLED